MRRQDAYIGLIRSTVVVVAIGLGWSSFALAEEPASPPAPSDQSVLERAVPGSPPTRRLSPLEAALQGDLRAMQHELQRLDSALQNPAVAPPAAVSASVPKLQGILRAVTSTVAAMKSQATKADDAAGVSRALALERQLLAVQQGITSLPAAAEGADVQMARKMCRAGGDKVKYLVITMENVVVSSYQ